MKMKGLSSVLIFIRNRSELFTISDFAICVIGFVPGFLGVVVLWTSLFHVHFYIFM